MSEYICPHCQRPIYDDEALLCVFCGESLQRSGRGTLGKMKYARSKWMMAAIIFIILLGFLLLIVR